LKKIEAFIRHEAFEPISSELLDKGFPSLSISEVKGAGRQKGLVEGYIRHARSGQIGDGKIFVLPVEEAIRIRTDEEGEVVLQAHTEEEIAAGAAAEE